MEADDSFLQGGRLSDELSPETLVAKTHHSILASRQWQGTKVIIKRFRHQDDPRTASRLLNEIEALKLVGRHENITQLLHADTSCFTLTLRFEPGQSLDKYIKPDMMSDLPPSDSTIIWTQMSSALGHLHAACSLIHDDVKPQNIMWDPQSRNSVLVDLGAALSCKDLPDDYFSPSGTPPYAPPEYLQRRKGVGGDVWALGVTMLFAFGCIELPGGNWILPEVFVDEEVRREMVTWLGQVEGWRKRLAGGEKGLLAEMLEADPAKRIGSKELARRLELNGEH